MYAQLCYNRVKNTAKKQERLPATVMYMLQKYILLGPYPCSIACRNSSTVFTDSVVLMATCISMHLTN